ncbi:hypothetical protein HCH_05819 [Hahella chejuensis KCTC 2396]|uniref:Uncharacterized protein n=1 Tax=Hahella chejuensis (strain KCTC 2396) TaxID=349521 RepID=Q2SA54_HAHCH|nr:hypothetical protein HCH_05819 [Hahella chejuensis KCTC 2396]
MAPFMLYHRQLACSGFSELEKVHERKISRRRKWNGWNADGRGVTQNSAG